MMTKDALHYFINGDLYKSCTKAVVREGEGDEVREVATRVSVSEDFCLKLF